MLQERETFFLLLPEHCARDSKTQAIEVMILGLLGWGLTLKFLAFVVVFIAKSTLFYL